MKEDVYWNFFSLFHEVPPKETKIMFNNSVSNNFFLELLFNARMQINSFGKNSFIKIKYFIKKKNIHVFPQRGT